MTRVITVHPGDLGRGEIEAWHQMQQATPFLADPFLSPEYAIAVGRLRPQARVGILMCGQRTVGFFPFEVRRLGVGGPISSWLSARQGVVHTPEAGWDMGELLRGCGLSAWRFDNLVAEQAVSIPGRASLAPAPVIDLTGGFAAYYAHLRSRVPRYCRELERKARKLGREVGELRLELDAQDQKLLGLLIQWKSDQYRRTSHVDRFARPWVTDLLYAMLDTHSAHLTGSLSVLYAGDQPVAIQFGLRCGGVLCGWFTGYNQDYCRYSPGLLQLRLMAEALAGSNVHALHMGKGANGALRVFKNSDVQVGAGVVTDRSVLGVAHRVHGDVSRQALSVVRAYPALHRTADQVLRRTRVSSLFYGRVLALPARDAASELRHSRSNPPGAWSAVIA